MMLSVEKVGGVDAKDIRGRTPLLYATENGHEAVVRLLLVSGEGVDVNASDKDGLTALLSAAANGDEGIMRMLLEMRAIDVDMKDNEGRTALLCAATNGDKGIVMILLEMRGIDVDVKDNEGRTALLHAAGSGHEDVIKMLVSLSEADVNSKDCYGRTPLSRAAESGSEEVFCTLLLRDEVDVNAEDTNGRTALLHAAEMGHKNIVRMLLDSGKTNVDANYNYGGTTTRKHEDIARMLDVEMEGVDDQRLHGPSFSLPTEFSSDTSHTPIEPLNVRDLILRTTGMLEFSEAGSPRPTPGLHKIRGIRAGPMAAESRLSARQTRQARTICQRCKWRRTTVIQSSFAFYTAHLTLELVFST